MKRITKISLVILTPAAVFVLLYLLFAFICNNINLFDEHIDVRAGLIFIWAIISILIDLGVVFIDCEE